MEVKLIRKLKRSIDNAFLKLSGPTPQKQKANNQQPIDTTDTNKKKK